LFIRARFIRAHGRLPLVGALAERTGGDARLIDQWCDSFATGLGTGVRDGSAGISYPGDVVGLSLLVAFGNRAGSVVASRLARSDHQAPEKVQTWRLGTGATPARPSPSERIDDHKMFMFGSVELGHERE
jgi:hypothetical protein